MVELIVKMVDLFVKKYPFCWKNSWSTCRLWIQTLFDHLFSSYCYLNYNNFISSSHEQTNHIQKFLVTVVDQKRSSRSVLLRAVMKNFANFTEKYLCRSLFLIKLQSFKPDRLFYGIFPPEKLSKHFWKIPKKTPVLKYCFSNVVGSRPNP